MPAHDEVATAMDIQGLESDLNAPALNNSEPPAMARHRHDNRHGAVPTRSRTPNEAARPDDGIPDQPNVQAISRATSRRRPVAIGRSVAAAGELPVPADVAARSAPGILGT